MLDDLINALSPAQKECLRLVARGRKSKEIAKLTGFAPATVDTYLSKAASILGVGSRREAALLFRQWESQQSGKLGFSGSVAEGRIDPDEQRDNPDGEADEAGRLIPRFISLPPIGGRKNELTGNQRIAAAFRVAMFSAMLLFAIALLLREGVRFFS